MPLPEKSNVTAPMPASASFSPIQGKNPHSRNPLNPWQTIAVMPRGSVFFWAGKTLHGAAANTTDEKRIGINCQFSVNWLTQEENTYLTVPMELVEKLPEKAQQLLGYRVFGSALGFVEGRDPECLLREGDNAPVL